MTITIKTRGPAPKGADLIGLKEALAELLEKNGLTVGRVDIDSNDDQIPYVPPTQNEGKRRYDSSVGGAAGWDAFCKGY